MKLTKIIFSYSVLAYIITWIISFKIYLLLEKECLLQYHLNLYHSFAAIGPTIAALLTSFLFYDKDGVKKLLLKIKFPKLNKELTLIILSPFIFFVIGNIVYAVLKSEWYSFKNILDTEWRSMNSFIFWILPLLTYSIFEEIGWRGFLLPHLQEKFNAWKSTIILTIIWGLWHIPFFFYRFDFSIGISIGFFLGIFVGSIILTSIYNSSRGFLIPTMIFHFLNNLCSAFDKEIIVAVISMGYIFISIYIIRKFGKKNMSRIDKTKNYFNII